MSGSTWKQLTSLDIIINMKRVLKTSDRCNLYTDIPKDIYRWIEDESFRLKTSKAKFIESVFRKYMNNEKTSTWINYEVRPYVNK